MPFAGMPKRQEPAGRSPPEVERLLARRHPTVPVVGKLRGAPFEARGR